MAGRNSASRALPLGSVNQIKKLKKNDRKFQVILINCSDSTDRLDFQTWQLGEMGFDFIRVDAFTPDNLPKVRESYWNKWRRPLRPKERARLLSHGLAWDWVVENGPALILEDDAVLARSVPEILDNLESVDGIEYLSLEVRGRRKLLSKSSIPIAHGIASHRLYLDRLGSAAYVLWPEGAQKMINRVSRGAVCIEGIAQWARKMKCYQADPACAVQLDMAEKYGLSTPIEAKSLSDAERFSQSQTIMQTVRLVTAQMHKVCRLLRYGLMSDRRKIELKPEYFDI